MTGGASAPQPSSSTFDEAEGRATDGVGTEMPPDRDGVKAGLVATGGRGLAAGVTAGPCDEAEYLEPEASPTRWMIPWGVRSPSARAVICTWYPYLSGEQMVSLRFGDEIERMRHKCGRLVSYM